MGTSLIFSFRSRPKLNGLGLQTIFFFLALSLGTLLAPSLAMAGDASSIQKKLELAPENLKLRHSLATLYFEEQKYDLCVQVLKEKAEKLKAESLILLAKAYEKLSDSLNERKALEQLTVNYPQYAPGFIALGDFFYRASMAKNDPKSQMDSQANYRMAIELEPNNRSAYDSLLRLYEQLNNLYEVRILLGDMVKRFGRKPELLSQLCRVNTIYGYFVNARKLCLEAIKSDGKNPENYVYLSLVENNEGNLKKAETLLKRVCKRFSGSEFALSNYADFLIQQKNLPGAQTQYKLAVKANAKSFRSQIGLARTSFDLKQYETALEAYSQACTLSPHVTYKLMKKASDWLRHRQENGIESRYSAALEKCMSTTTEARAPSSFKKENWASPFAIYSKNKLPE